MSEQPEKVKYAASRLMRTRFAHLYVENGFNGTKAYQKLHPDVSDDNCAAIACRWLKEDEVADQIADIVNNANKASRTTIQRVVAELVDTMEADYSGLFDWITEPVTKVKKDEEGEDITEIHYVTHFIPKDRKDLTPEQLKLIKGASKGKDGFKIDLKDPEKAREALQKWLGMDKQVVDKTVKGEINVHIDSDDAKL